MDLIPRSRAKHGVLRFSKTKDGRLARSRSRPSFETPASKSAVADFDTSKCRSRAGPTSVQAPQDEVDSAIRTSKSPAWVCLLRLRPAQGRRPNSRYVCFVHRGRNLDPGIAELAQDLHVEIVPHRP